MPLPTEGFRISRLPQTAEFDPNRYAFDRQALGQAITFPSAIANSLGQASETAFDLKTKKKTRADRLSLAEQQAAADAEDFAQKRAAEIAKMEQQIAAAKLGTYQAGEDLTNAQVNADINAQTAQQEAINRARTAGMQAELEQRKRAAEDAAARRADELAASLAKSREAQGNAATVRADASVAKANLDAQKAEQEMKYREALTADVTARAAARGARVVDTQPVTFPDGKQAMVFYIQTIDENGQPVLKPEFHELPEGVKIMQRSGPTVSFGLPPGAGLGGQPADTATPPASPVATPAASASPPVMTPEQVRAAPSGTRYMTVDGRLGVKP